MASALLDEGRQGSAVLADEVTGLAMDTASTLAANLHPCAPSRRCRGPLPACRLALRILAALAALQGLAGPSPAVAEEQPPSLLLCHEDRDAYPWSMADGSGLNRQLLARVERALSVQFRYVALPWRRCLDGVARGLYDGAFAASLNLERTKGAVYPLTAQGLPERGKRLHTATYSLYRRIGQGPEWDGDAFHRLDGRIGSLSGFSIVDFLRAHGAEVDETSRDPLALLSMVKNRRIEAAALQVLRADFILKAHPELNEDLEKVEIPLEVKDYYLVFSPRFAAQRPQVIRQIWDSIEDQRESLGYQANIKAFMSQ